MEHVSSIQISFHRVAIIGFMYAIAILMGDNWNILIGTTGKNGTS
jgi:hypothetical protein